MPPPTTTMTPSSEEEENRSVSGTHSGNNPYINPPTHMYNYSPPVYPNSFPPPPYQPGGYNQMPPYSAYPSPPPQNLYHHQPMLPPTAYYPGPNQLPRMVQEPKSKHYFARIVLCMLIVLVVATTCISIVTWLVFGSDVPQFEVNSFTVYHFNYSGLTMRTSVEMNVTADNPNHKLDMSFEHIECSLIYRENLVDTSLAAPLDVGKQSKGNVEAKFGLASLDHQNTTQAYWLKEMEMERRKGTVVYDVKMILATTIASGNVWRRQTTFRVFCQAIVVTFPDLASGFGRWNSSERECLVQ